MSDKVTIVTKLKHLILMQFIIMSTIEEVRMDLIQVITHACPH